MTLDSAGIIPEQVLLQNKKTQTDKTANRTIGLIYLYLSPWVPAEQ